MNNTTDVSNMKKLLKPYIQVHKNWIKSADFIDWDKEHRDKSSQYSKLLSKRGINDMTEAEIYELVSTLWAFGGWGNKDYLVDRLLKAVDLSTFKHLLRQLLWSSEPLWKRYDQFNNNVKYLGSAAITEILSFVHPSQCAIWNERARTALQKVGLLKDLVKQYWISGHDYEKICEEYKRILNVMLDSNINAVNLLDVDLFLYNIAISEDEEEAKPEDYEFDHNEVKERIIEVGQYLGFDAEKEVLIAKGARVDATWTVNLGNLGVVKYVFEIQKSGSVDSLLLNLQRAKRNPSVQKEIIVSNVKGIAKTKEEANTLGEEFTRHLAYLEVADVLKMAKSLKEAWQIINRLELVKTMW